jgi:flavin-dependent dehydrogenase
MPGAVEALAGLGVDPAGFELTGIRYLSGGRSTEAAFRGGPGRGVRRTTLHGALRSAVAAAGIEVVHQPVTRVTQDDDAVQVDGASARYLLAADGLHSPVRRQLGLERPRTASRRYGLRLHASTPPWTSYVEVHWSATCEAYVTPVASDLVGVALLTRTRRPLAEQLREFPALQDRLAGSPTGDVLGAGPLHRRTYRRVAGRVLLVGDASGYVDALTGEGIALGMAQAEAAVAAIADGRPRAYERSWERVTWRYRLLTNSLLAATRVPAVRRSLVPAAAALPGVFAAGVNELARPA